VQSPTFAMDLKFMRRIYYLSTCDTCRRIMKETGTEGFELFDIKKENISASDLDLAKESIGSYENLFNKRAQKLKKNGIDLTTKSENEMRTLILGEYSFLKRPVYFIDHEVFAGNSTATVSAIKEQLGV